MSALVPRATIDQIVANRNRALSLYTDAHSALGTAASALQEALSATLVAAPTQTGINHHAKEERSGFLSGLDLPIRDDFLGAARRMIDTDVWAHLIRMTELDTLMDKRAKDEFRSQLQKDPPEVTVENVIATLEQFALDAGTIFRRGIAMCFSSLDRRFRSHDGWKIGSRVILTRAFNEYGSWNYYRNERDTIHDIERAFMVLEGKPVPLVHAGLVAAIEESRAGHYGARQSFVETEYFRVRCFMNGNAHLWFKRDDLLDKVNQLLGEYYGAPIPEERGPDEDWGLHTPKTSLAKNYGFYPTPDAATERVVDAVPLYRQKDEPPLRVLEPSAGTGNLARPLVRKGCIVDCVEINEERAAGLRREWIYNCVQRADFLALQPPRDGLYDRVVMNPPFDRERDIDHVVHALKFLRPGGILVAIMSAGTEFRSTKKTTAFRKLMIDMNGQHVDLPAGSFASVGTYCNTIIVKVRKPDPSTLSRHHDPYFGARFEVDA